MTAYAPYVGFGDPETPEHFAHFGVLIQGNEDVYPGWRGDLIESNRQIANSSDSVTQVMGHRPVTLTLRLSFDTQRQYQRLRSFYGRVGTLSLLAGFATYGGIIRTHNGVDYERLDNTFLANITDDLHALGGGVECTATFRRAGQQVTPW